MTLTELVNLLEDFALIVATLLLAYVAYRIAQLVDAITSKVSEKTSKETEE